MQDIFVGKVEKTAGSHLSRYRQILKLTEVTTVAAEYVELDNEFMNDS